MAFVRLVGRAQGDAVGQLGELGAQDFARFSDDDLPALPAGDAAEDEQVAQVVEVRAVRDGVAEADADRLVDEPRARIARSHELLHLDETFGEFHLGGKVQPGEGREAGHTLLAEILHRAAGVAAPLIDRRVVAVVHGGKGEFVEPRGDRAVGVDVTAGDARAHRDAEHGVFTHAHRASQGRDFAIIHHLERHAAPRLLQVEEDAADALLKLRRSNATEERSDAHFVADIDARGAAANGIHARQVLRRAAQRCLDAVVVILRIALKIRVPRHLLGEDDAPVDDCGALAIRAAEVEADAAAIQVAAQRHGGFAGRGHVGEIAGLDGELPAIDLAAHELGIEFPRAGRGVNAAQHFGNRRIAADDHAPAAARPEEELHEPLHVAAVEGHGVAGVREDDCVVARDRAIGALQRDGERVRAGIGGAAGAVCAIPQRSGHEAGVERWN